mmetsp:Transcript_46436/g.143852  ORF Transcript_46436/g.143852 Transcript_46436/m.143852 type:complete len:238 (-) Transcript_46436:133-846(-)
MDTSEGAYSFSRMTRPLKAARQAPPVGKASFVKAQLTIASSCAEKSSSRRMDSLKRASCRRSQRKPSVAVAQTRFAMFCGPKAWSFRWASSASAAMSSSSWRPMVAKAQAVSASPCGSSSGSSCRALDESRRKSSSSRHCSFARPQVASETPQGERYLTLARSSWRSLGNRESAMTRWTSPASAAYRATRCTAVDVFRKSKRSPNRSTVASTSRQPVHAVTDTCISMVSCFDGGGGR